MNTNVTLSNVRESLVNRDSNIKQLVHYHNTFEPTGFVTLMNKMTTEENQKHCHELLNLILDSNRSNIDDTILVEAISKSGKKYIENYLQSFGIFDDIMVNVICYNGRLIIDDRFSLSMKAWTDQTSINRLKLKDYETYEILEFYDMVTKKKGT